MQITLGESTFDLPERFKLRQLRDMSVALAGLMMPDMDNEKRMEMWWKVRERIVRTALEGIAPQDFDLMERNVTPDQFGAAVNAILEISELRSHDPMNGANSYQPKDEGAAGPGNG